jgi:hypothetical protein
MPLAPGTCRVHAPAASTTIGPSIVPFAVVTPVTLPPLMFTASTSRLGNKFAPPAAAALAWPTAICAGSKYLSSPILIAASTRFGFKNGLRRLGLLGRDELDIKAHATPALNCGRRAIFRLPENTQSSGWPVSSVNASILRQASLMRLIIRSLFRAQLTMPAARVMSAILCRVCR